MLTRLDFLKTHLVKTDPNSVDEEEKYGDEDQVGELPSGVSQSSQLIPARTVQDKATKSKQATIVEDAKSKGSKSKKVVEPKVQEQAIIPEPMIESMPIVEEILLNRPPTPPKPKSTLPPLDLSNFMKYVELSPR
jgi:hypothetical protein